MHNETLRLNKSAADIREATEALKGMTQEEMIEMMREETERLNNETARKKINKKKIK